ncbi:MAG: thioredoxin family protein [Chlamydiales bacterium]|nr:thioredoxin family protein [Chlamydiales bacterium]
MKFYTALCALTALCGTSYVHAATTNATAQVAESSQINWLTDLDTAKAQARNESKPIFLYFTGSDWCPYCVKMNTQILSTPEFQDALAQKMIFVKIDFPRNTPLEKAAQEYNEKLSKSFGVQGFPTVILLDSKGSRIEKIGFQAGGGAKYAQKVQDILDAHNAK